MQTVVRMSAVGNMKSEVKRRVSTTKSVRIKQAAKQPRKGLDPGEHEALIEEGLREYRPIWENLAKK